MTKFVETKMVEQTNIKFVADDGKEFIGENAERSCRDYERRQNEERVIKEFKKLKPKWLDIPLVEWVGCENEVISVTAKDEVDFDTTIRDYYYIKSPQWMDFEAFDNKKPKEFPCDIILVSGCEWVDIFGSKEDLKEALQKALEQLG